MKKIAMLLVLSATTIGASNADAQSSVPVPSQSQVNFVKECMQKNGVVLQEPAKGGKVVMTEKQKKIVETCSKIVAQDLMLDAADK